MALALAALPACGKCRRLEPKEKPLERCVLYRHKEDLPLDAAPFFDLYSDGQAPDSFRNLWLRDELPYRAPLFQTEGGIPGTSEGHKLTLEHQICLVAAADLCSFLDPFSGSTEHQGYSPLTSDVREYQPDIPINQRRGPVFNERSPTYDWLPPFTQWQEKHPEGFWSGTQYEGHAEPGDYHATPRERPFSGPTMQQATSEEPFSLRAVDDYFEPADFKNARTSGADAIGNDGTSCHEQCTWLRGKVSTLWAESGRGQDAECSAAQVWFDNGCWYDGTPVLDNGAYTQRPVQQFQRQKTLAMFSACEYLNVAPAPDVPSQT
jgi:hypothetical protein